MSRPSNFLIGLGVVGLFACAAAEEHREDRQDVAGRTDAGICSEPLCEGEPAEAVVLGTITADPQPPSTSPEVECNNVDEDGDGSDLCIDVDGDGVGTQFDCNDSDPDVAPGVAEIRCDGADQNCDGMDDCDTDGDGVLDRDDCYPEDPELFACDPPQPPEPLP
jgi:hypothetical protein